MVYDHINDNHIFKKPDSTCDNKVMNRIKKLIQNLKNILTKLEIDYLTNVSASTSNFCGLPKIHKFTLISEAIATQNNEYVEVLEPSDLKLWPVVAGPTCPTWPSSHLLDRILKPSMLHAKHYVRDNIDFLERCSIVNSKNTILATFDLIILHTNIPQPYGIEAK